MSTMRGLRIAAWVVASANVVFLGMGLADMDGTLGWLPWALIPFVALAFLVPPAVGLLIANRQPRNVIAWILLVGPLAMTVQVPLALALGKGGRCRWTAPTWPLLYAWPIAIAFVFPTGKLLSRRWRWVAGAGDR